MGEIQFDENYGNITFLCRRQRRLGAEAGGRDPSSQNAVLGSLHQGMAVPRAHPGGH